MTQEKIRDEGNANEESALGASSAATSSHVKTERYIRDVPGGYEEVTVERFKGERPASPAAKIRNILPRQGATMARDLHDGHIHPRGHFCGSNCPKHKPEGVSAACTCWPKGGLPHGEHPYDYGYDDPADCPVHGGSAAPDSEPVVLASDFAALLRQLEEVADVAHAAISWTTGDVKITLEQRLKDALNG